MPKLTKQQINNRISRLETADDARLGGFLWNVAGEPDFEKVCQDLDSARSTIAFVNKSAKYGPKLRQLIFECLAEEWR